MRELGGGGVPAAFEPLLTEGGRSGAGVGVRVEIGVDVNGRGVDDIVTMSVSVDMEV